MLRSLHAFMLLVLLHAASAAMSAQMTSGSIESPVFQAKSAPIPEGMCAECYELDSVSAVSVSISQAQPLTCGLQGAAMAALTGDCLDLGELAKDCLTSCLFSMLPIPDPCGKFGKLFSTVIGFANSFEGDTPVHVRVLTDSGYLHTTKAIKDIAVGDEVLAWDEVKAFDIAQTKETLKLQAHLQAKSASSRQETCAECSSIDSAQRYEKVTDVMSSVKEQTLYHISLDNGQTIQATAGHPFKTNEGWRDAVMLKKGGKLLLKGGEGSDGDADASSNANSERYATITNIQEELKTTRVFNLEVANLHTFYVGEDGVVVHNARPPNLQNNNSAGGQLEQNVTDAINNQGTNTATRGGNRINTPFGPRYPDITVRNKAGSIVGLIECKKGNSRYKSSQRAKDEWIRREYGWNTTVVRD
jgi:hypothetical protein